MNQPDKKRLLIISNRLPVTFSAKKGSIQITQSSGGLVSSISSYIDNHKTSNDPTEVVWIGSSDLSETKFSENFTANHISFGQYTLCPVFLPKETRDRFYNGFCNDTLWPLFHYFPSYAKFNEVDYLIYREGNLKFAEKIMEIYQPGDTIWVHDYHLMLLPALLRSMQADILIGFFLHIPFPSFEIFRLLPSIWRKEILEGLLGSDLIGFHTNDYAQYFLRSVRQILGYDDNMRMLLTPDRSIAVDVFPVSIDYQKFYQSIYDRNTLRHVKQFRKDLKGLHTVVSVDRLDYTKGIVNRLESFELFMTKHPQYIKQVSYLLVVVPSRDIITKYRENKKEIEQAVSRINGKFGSIGYTPVVYQYRSLDFDELTGLYLAADVAFIAPVRDGMNLVAKEFVATWSNGEGVLILSETAGAAAELGEALLVNPTDREEMANAIYTALNMKPHEQISRNKIMQKQLKEYDVTRWAEDFISSLKQSKEQQENFLVKKVDTHIKKLILNHYSSSENRLLLFDYDGTLAPLARLPHEAAPSAELHELLESLSEHTGNSVAIISGRPQETLEQWFGHLPINLVAEHGAFSKQIDGPWKKNIQINIEWKKEVFSILQRFSAMCPGSFAEEKKSSIAWHYRNVSPELGFLRSRELVDTLDQLSVHQDFYVMQGNKVVEIRSRGCDKGTAATHLLGLKTYDFVLAIGDDKTDEDMFRVIPDHGYSIRIGMVTGNAKYNFRDQRSVLPFLTEIKMMNEADVAK